MLWDGERAWASSTASGICCPIAGWGSLGCSVNLSDILFGDAMVPNIE